MKVTSRLDMVAESPRNGRIKRGVYLCLGLVLLAIGAIGIVLPLLPTTPLWLLASFCLARSSQRLNDWLRGTKFFQAEIQPILDGHGITLKSKIGILTTVWILLLVMFFRTDILGLKILAISLGVIKTAVFYHIKTAPPTGTAPAVSVEGESTKQMKKKTTIQA